MRHNYSRLARVEESRNVRMTVAFGVGTLLIIVLLVAFGIPAVTNFAGYIFDLKGKPAVTFDDKTPPGPPFIAVLPEATNKQNIEASGTAEAGATVSVHVNDEVTETQADENGKFSLNITLAKGNNTIFAKAKDKAGNESADSNQYLVYFSKEKPKLEITKPSQGSNFYGEGQRQIAVEGATCLECSVTVNDRIALVDSAGNFKLSYSLNNGSNDLNIKASDKAGNIEETTINVVFNP